MNFDLVKLYRKFLSLLLSVLMGLPGVFTPLEVSQAQMTPAAQIGDLFQKVVQYGPGLSGGSSATPSCATPAAFAPPQINTGATGISDWAGNLKRSVEYTQQLTNNLAQNKTAEPRVVQTKFNQFNNELSAKMNELSCDRIKSASENDIKFLTAHMQYLSYSARLGDSCVQEARLAFKNTADQIDQIIQAQNSSTDANGTPSDPVSQLYAAAQPLLNDLRNAEGILDGGNTLKDLPPPLTDSTGKLSATFRAACGHFSDSFNGAIKSAGLNTLMSNSTFTQNKLGEELANVNKIETSLRCMRRDKKACEYADMPHVEKDISGTIITESSNGRKRRAYERVCEFSALSAKDMYFFNEVEQGKAAYTAGVAAVRDFSASDFTASVPNSEVSSAKSSCRSTVRDCFYSTIAQKDSAGRYTYLRRYLGRSGHDKNVINNVLKAFTGDAGSGWFDPESSSAPAESLRSRINAFGQGRGKKTMGKVSKALNSALYSCSKNYHNRRKSLYRRYDSDFKKTTDPLLNNKCKEGSSAPTPILAMGGSSSGKSAAPSQFSCSYSCYPKQRACLSQALTCRNHLESTADHYRSVRKNNRDFLYYHLTGKRAPASANPGEIPAINRILNQFRQMDAFLDGLMESSGINGREIRQAVLTATGGRGSLSTEEHFKNFISLDDVNPNSGAQALQIKLMKIKEFYGKYLEKLKTQQAILAAKELEFENLLNNGFQKQFNAAVTKKQNECMKTFEEQAEELAERIEETCKNCPQPGQGQTLLGDVADILISYGLGNSEMKSEARSADKELSERWKDQTDISRNTYGQGLNLSQLDITLTNFESDYESYSSERLKTCSNAFEKKKMSKDSRVSCSLPRDFDFNENLEDKCKMGRTSCENAIMQAKSEALSAVSKFETMETPTDPGENATLTDQENFREDRKEYRDAREKSEVAKIVLQKIALAIPEGENSILDVSQVCEIHEPEIQIGEIDQLNGCSTMAANAVQRFKEKGMQFFEAVGGYSNPDGSTSAKGLSSFGVKGTKASGD